MTAAQRKRLKKKTNRRVRELMQKIVDERERELAWDAACRGVVTV